jgi:hypothetical protein
VPDAGQENGLAVVQPVAVPAVLQLLTVPPVHDASAVQPA